MLPLPVLYNMSMRIILILFLLGPLTVSAQLEFYRSNGLTVTRNGETLDYAWSGGLNSSQWSPIDLNNDGIDDLFIYDRSARTFNTYLANPSNSKYELVFDYANAFPPVRDWVLLRDYNCDGKNDIFTYTPGGIRVYKNTSQGSSVSFELKEPILLSFYDFGSNPYYSSIYMSNVDIPSIDDFDGDGDLDIHTFTLAGQTIEFHENLSADIGICDSLAFVLENRCYGMAGEDAISPNIYIGQEYLDGNFCTFNVPDPEEGPKSMKNGGAHSGSTLCAFDYDNNGQKDLLLGDITAEDMTLIYIEDRGILPDSATSKEVGFPIADIPIDMKVFNAAFYVDVDMDEVNDLMVSPGNATESEDVDCTWFYKNNGTNEAPVFNLQSTGHFQNDMIDMGTGAFPRLVDVNADGRLDLIVSNRGFYQEDGTFSEAVYAFIQSGPTESPIFDLQEEDFQGLGALGFGGHIVPSFGDMDNDGDQDMFLGDGDGELHYFENTAGPGQAMVLGPYVTLQANGNDLDLGANLIPQIFDLDQDGLLDLMVGERNGHVNYLKNQGTAEVFDLVLVEDTIGNLLTDLDGNQVGYSAPWFFLNEEGGVSGLFGTEHGAVYYVADVDPDPTSTWIITDSAAFGIMNGVRACPVLVDINSDGLPDIINGNLSGGLGLYLGGTPPVGLEEIPLDLPFSLAPNPASGIIHLRANPSTSSTYDIIIMDMMGRMVYHESRPSEALMDYILDVSFLSSGTYIIVLTSEESQGMARFVKE